MKKSLYIQICSRTLGLIILLMPYFFSVTALAGAPSQKADYDSFNPVNHVVDISTPDFAIYMLKNVIPDSTLISFTGSSNYTFDNLFKRNTNQNIISGKAFAAPPTITCPGNIVSNTDPGFCRASKSGIAAVINDPDGDITTLTWTMTGATIAASPISGINNITGSYNFNKGITAVTYRVTDAGGSAVTCSFTVTVTDIEAPTIVCPPNQNLTIPSCASITDPISFSPLSMSDNCGILNFTSNAPLQFPLGTTSVLWTAHDINGNSNQCTQSVTVINEVSMSLAGSSTPISCFGGNDGTASVAVSGGSPPFTYSWNTVPVQTNSSITNLLPGTYNVTVTDFYGCSASTSVVVSQPVAAVAIAVTGQVNVNCFGGTTGSVTVAGIAGTPGYQFSIDGVVFQAGTIFSNLAAGTYTFTVKDSKNCTNTTTATITQPASGVTVSITAQTNVACLGSATGSVTVAGNGGAVPYQYNINGGTFQASGTFSGLIAGTYTVMVRDANSCTNSVLVTITQSPTSLVASISGHTNVSCSGGATGSATVTASGGLSPYTYSWNSVPVQTAATAINLTARNYVVTVTDAAGCKATANVTITQPAPLVVTMSKTDILCSGDSSGIATALASGGTPPYTYAWLTTPIQTTATLTNLPAGTYTVAVFDALGCFKPAFITINQPAAKLIASITSQVNVACAGTNTGSVTVSGSGGTAPIQYNINGGTYQASGTFNSLAAGTYTIIARDANNCMVPVSVTIIEPASPLTAVISSQINVSCSGGATGSATVLAGGGTAPYTYSWNSVPVQTAATAINLTARNYTVTVRDAAGCTRTASVIITQPTPLVVTMFRTNVACNGDLSGTATALATGGTPPYTYAWLTTPIQTTATISNLPAGTYTVAVFDSLGCFKPAFITVTQPATKLIASITGQVNVVCAGSNTGSITVSGSGGVAPIQYNINGGTFQASGTFSSLAAGSYTILARDANNCTVTIPATITEPASPLTSIISSHTNVSCSGGATGSATVTPSGGTAPYTYSWNSVPVQTAATAINLTARAYTVTVRDAAGCTKTAMVTLTQPSPLVVAMSKTDVTCFGDSTGSVTALATGGTPPYTYAWLTTPIQTTATVSNLPAGTYTVAVFDSLGCFKPAFATVSQPATKLIASITSQVNVACAGNSTGSITVSGSGGIAPIQYNINGGAFQASGTFINLAAGSYTISAKDANNCTVIIPATITAPASALTASVTSQTNVSCSGGSTGSATVTASGGTAPYSYSWNSVPVQTTATASNLTARNYIVTVTDAAGCTQTVNTTITQPAPLVVTMSKTDVSCFGDSTGTVTALASGGTPPYTYAWITTPIQTTATVSNLPVGTYTVAVFDSLGCFKPAFITISQPPTALTANITNLVNVACGGSTGSLTISGGGGIAPYQYRINGGTLQASGLFNNLSAGNYSATVVDANNCSYTISVPITEPANALKASITSQSNVLCTGQANGSATITATDGNGPYTYSWNTVPVQTTATINNLAAGLYIVTSTDNTGCFVTDTAFITEPSPLVVSIINQVNYDCATGTNGSVTVTGIGGTPGYSYSLDGSPFQVNDTFLNLAVGNYTITVQDTNNCTANLDIEITVSGLVHAVADNFSTPEDTQLDANVMANDQVLCNLPITVTSFTAPQFGSVAVNADGTFTYIPSINFNGNDSFNYTLTDNVGDTSSATVTITIDPVNDPPVTLNDSVTVNYNLASTGNILLNGHFDPDGTALTVNTLPVSDPVSGTFVIAADGSFTYTPSLNFIGNDMVIVSLCDGGIPLPSACSNDTIFIVVLPPNLPPVTIPENIVVCGDGSFTGTTSNGGTVFNGDSDPENNLPLTINSTPVLDAAHGTFSITDPMTGTFSYIPNAGYTGSDLVIISMCDSGIPVECSNDTIYINVVTSIVADAGISQKLCNADVAFLVGNLTTIGTSGWTFVSGPNVPVISPSAGNVAAASGLIASITSYVFAYTIDNGGCVSTDTISVLNNSPSTPAYAGIDQDFCNLSGSLTATLAANTPTDGTGTWTQLSGPTAATILDVTNPNTDVSDLTNGVYSFEWLISNGVCSPSADVVNITVSQPAVVNAGIDLSTCELLPVAVSGSTILNSSSMLWTTTGNGTFNDPAILTPVYTPGSLDLTMGTVKLTLTAPSISPCTDASDFVLLTINKSPVVDAGPSYSICVGNSRTISQATASDYSNLQWSVDPVTAGTLTNSETLTPTFTPAPGFSGTATLTLSAQGIGLCTASQPSDAMTFEVNSTLVANAGMDQIIPPGAIAALNGTVTGGTGFYAWSWQPSALLVNSLIENPVTLPLAATTTFTLSVLDITTGCTDEDTVEIAVDSEANAIEAVADNDTTLINTSGTFDVLDNDINADNDPLTLSICGYPTHGLVIINSDNTITYTPYSDFEGDDEFCYRICSEVNPVLCSEAKVSVNVKQPTLNDLFAYTGISPNDDGLNDVWKVRGIEKYPDNTVIIFNRWGDKLREFANYNNSTRAWDGRNEKGELVPDGTYYYLLEVKNVGTLKGWIYIRGKN